MIPRTILSRIRGNLPRFILGLGFCAGLVSALCLRAGAANAAAPVETHTFTLAGGQTLTGQVASAADDNLTLKVDGKSIHIPISTLGKADQDYINQWELKNAIATHAKFFDIEARENPPTLVKTPSGASQSLLSYRVTITNVSKFTLSRPVIQYIVASRSDLQIIHLTSNLTFGTVKPESLAPGGCINIETDKAKEMDQNSRLLGIRVRITDPNNHLLQDWGSPNEMLTRVYASFPKSGAGTSFNSHDQPGGTKGSGGSIVAPTWDSSFPMPGDP